MILLIDNYDSFVYNLARYFEELGRETTVVRNDALSVDEVRGLAPDAIVLSPGPCGPDEAGISLEVVRRLGPRVPILGVCLGHQAIGAAYGGHVTRAAPVHGRTSEIYHDGVGVFRGLPSPFVAARYHSLVVTPESVGDSLRITARTADGTVMGLSHREHPVTGIQFHPESVLTAHGHALLASFLEDADAHGRSERQRAARSASTDGAR